MSKMLGTYKIRQVGNSRVITIPQSAVVDQEDQLNLFQTENGDLLYQYPQKTNPNPWNIVTAEDLDSWNADFSYMENDWFKSNPDLKSPIKHASEQPNSLFEAPQLGDVILYEECNGHAPKDSQNFFANHALFIVMSQAGFNRVMPMYYGFQIHPVPYDVEYMHEPAYEAYKDQKYGINGTLDKTQLQIIPNSSYTLVNHLSVNKLADLRFDLRNIFDMN